MRIQCQLSNGKWMDIDAEQIEGHLERVANNNGVDATGKIVPAFRAARLLTRDEVIAALEGGAILRNDPADWYSNTRMAPTTLPAPPAATTVRCQCGHVVERTQALQASTGTACPECYDRMSD